MKIEEESTTLGLLEILAEELPIKREVIIDGWPRSVWVWKLDLVQMDDLNKKRALLNDGERGFLEWSIELLACCLGDSNAPGVFATAHGRSWLRRQPEAVAKLVPIATDFNELSGPSKDRKKKLLTQDEPEPYSTSAEPLA